MLSNDLKQVLKEFPDLEVKYKNKKPWKILGPIEIFDGNGKRWDTYEVKVKIDYDHYPYSFPVLKEISNKIPEKPERHINSDGSCCVTVRQDEQIQAHKGISILRFIKKYAIPFLANQIYFEETGTWFNGDHPHGEKGEINFYFLTFNTNRPWIILKGIDIVLQDINLERNKACFCGKNIKYKKCHLPSIEEISHLSTEKLKEDKQLIKINFNESKSY